MRGHLQCRDTLAGNEGCPLKTGTTVPALSKKNKSAGGLKTGGVGVPPPPPRKIKIMLRSRTQVDFSVKVVFRLGINLFRVSFLALGILSKICLMYHVYDNVVMGMQQNNG